MTTKDSESNDQKNIDGVSESDKVGAIRQKRYFFRRSHSELSASLAIYPRCRLGSIRASDYTQNSTNRRLWVFIATQNLNYSNQDSERFDSRTLLFSEPNIIEDCIYCTFEGLIGDMHYAEEKMRIYAYETNLQAKDECHIVLTNIDEKKVVADTFVPVRE